jgi:hypothetical protein
MEGVLGAEDAPFCVVNVSFVAIFFIILCGLSLKISLFPEFPFKKEGKDQR